MSISATGGFPVERFVVEPHQDFICGICFEVLNNPHQCLKGHCFCFSCGEQAIACKSQCPSCRIGLTNNSFSECLVIRNMIGRLTVKCENEGCLWSGELSQHTVHVTSECDAIAVTCSGYEKYVFDCFCFNKVTRGEMAQHLEQMESLTLSVKRINEFESLVVDGWETVVDESVKFKGVIKNGLKHGAGVLKCSDGKFMAGQWEQGVLTVLEATQDDNSLYYSTYIDGLRHGRGINTFSDFIKYCGDFVRDFYEGQGRLLDFDGSEYVGEFRDGLKHGTGILAINSIVIEGEWCDGKMSGEMVVTYPDRLVYTGHLSTSLKRNGSGALREANNALIYNGERKNDKRHGKGVNRFDNGDVLDGSWRRDMPHGMCDMKYGNGNRYIGSFANNLRSGQGVFTYAAGHIYEGMWWNDSFDGKGRLTFAATRSEMHKYEGEFRANRYQGRGELWWTNGQHYKGQFEHNSCNGEGTMEYSDGSVYVGYLERNLRCGRGVMIFSNGDVHAGLWAEDHEEGEGKRTFAAGGSQTGEFKAGHLHQGQDIDAEGTEITGTFVNQEAHGECTMKYTNGMVYIGTMEENLRHGAGRMIFQDGAVFTGTWIEDVKQPAGKMTFSTVECQI